MTARPWWRLLVGGEAWCWCSFAAEFFCGLGREKSLLACPTLTRCRFRVAPFLPGGSRGKPSSTLLRAMENPRTIWSGQQRRVDGVPLLEGVAWLWSLWSASSVVGLVGGCSGCGSSSLRRLTIVFISFLLGMFCYCPIIFLISNPCIVGVIAI
jgi:hypothetical protein